jgi:2-deoxy-D-gluconate 3-dehydrogenase
MMSRLDGKKALVTGGSRGLGRAIALAFADAGADVALASRSLDVLDQVAGEIREKERDAMTIEVDVAESESVAKMVDATVAHFGRIDILVNSAGVAWTERIVDMNDGTWDWVVKTNLYGTFYCCRQVGQVMMQQKSGSIVNLASVAGAKGPPALGAYAASKGGIMALTKVLALELVRYNVRANAIAPGYFRTDMNAAALDDPDIGPKITKRIPMRRPGNPEEIGPLAVYLASDDASFVTGEIYSISGGETAQ